MQSGPSQDPEHDLPAHLLLGFCGLCSFAKDTVEVCFSAGGQVLSWMKRRGKKKRREENEDLIISQLLLSCAGKIQLRATLSFGVSHFLASNDFTQDTDTEFSDNQPPARWSLAL